MPKPYREEFRDDGVRDARSWGALEQIMKDFGISESCLTNWFEGH